MVFLKNQKIKFKEKETKLISQKNIISEADFQNKVNEICGTRFEIISIKMEYKSEEGAKINVLNGTFKCFVKSQM